MRPKWRIPKVMRQKYYSPQETLREYLAERNRSPKIKMIADDNLSDTEIQEIHTNGDCFISLCRTEGWGMGAFEAAFYGKPIVMTGFGGQTDFLPNDKAWLVNYSLVSVFDEQAPQSYSSNQKWAEPDVDDAAQKMRYIFENREEAIKRGEKLKAFVQSEFSKEETVKKLLQFIWQLSSKHE
jgi:glycosyltransferase involved in cell wall biosynthesis